MKYKAGDRVHVPRLKQDGTVVDLSGTKEHPYYVQLDATMKPFMNPFGFYAEGDLEVSHVPQVNDDVVDRVIMALHRYGEKENQHAFGLPVLKEKHMDAMRKLVREAIAPATPALPERREHGRIFTELDKEVADDARLFEEYLGFRPERRETSAYQWGWCYAMESMQARFLRYQIEELGRKVTINNK